MYKKAMVLSLVSVLLVGGVALAAWASERREETITLDQTPVAVRAAILRQVGAGQITEVETETKNGVTIYEAAWSLNGVKYEAAVTSDGALLEIEEVVPPTLAPTAVQAAIAAHFDAGAEVVVAKKTIVLYEIEGRVNGKQREIVVWANGKVRGGGHADDSDDDDSDDDDSDDDDSDDDGDDGE